MLFEPCLNITVEEANRDVNHVGCSALQLAESCIFHHVRRLDGPRPECER
jgi:hypothetical protein